jgi:hypothetical protein
VAKIPLRTGDEENIRPPNPDILKRDPIAEMFGPGSGLKILGDPDDDIPDEVRGVIDEYGLSKKSFQCVLKEIPQGSTIGENSSSSSLNSKYIKGWVRQIPSLEYIARTYGPGMYLLCFSWRAASEDGSRPSVAGRQEVPVEISEKFADEYKKHRLSQKIQDADKLSTQVRDTLIEKNLESKMIQSLSGGGEQMDAKQTAKAYIAETIENARMLGLSPMASQVPARTFEWDKLLPALLGGFTAFMQMQQEAARQRQEASDKMFMLMLSQNQSASQNLIEIMKTQSGVGSGNMAIKEFKDMVLGALDVKEALNSQNQKEGLADKIFRVVESVAPQILSIAATTAQARANQNNPMVKLAKGYINNNPDFEALKHDPNELKVFIGKLDANFGWKSTDAILQVSGWERPDYCPRVPEQENPPPVVANVEEGEIVED